MPLWANFTKALRSFSRISWTSCTKDTQEIKDGRRDLFRHLAIATAIFCWSAALPRHAPKRPFNCFTVASLKIS